MKLTLNKAWELCVDGQWKWIARQVRACIKEGIPYYIGNLKRQWCEKNGYSVELNCFFCEYKLQHPSERKENCPTCPAKKIDKTFYCMNTKYDFADEPLKFYAEIRKLNRKWLKAKS